MSVATAAASGLTHELCTGLLSANRAGLPPEVTAEARRGVRDAARATVAGSSAETVTAILAAADRLGPPGEIGVPGRPERVSSTWACLAIGAAAHAGGLGAAEAAIFAALVPSASPGQVDGAEFLVAYALGLEAQLRVTAAMSPWHPDEGWDDATTTGVLGAAVAVAIALGLDEDGLLQAIGIAASTTLGTREGFGTMVQPFHAGKAAANGWLAAHLAARDFTGSRGVLEAPRGYFSVLSPHGTAPERVTDGLGKRWLLLEQVRP